jgi:hypothetical protein
VPDIEGDLQDTGPKLKVEAGKLNVEAGGMNRKATADKLVEVTFIIHNEL